jgi:SAM-dependent methyltransferase
MDIERLREEKRQLVERYGEWTDHNIQLGGDLYTIDEGVAPEKLRRIVQLVSDILAAGGRAPEDIAGPPFAGLRVLDLACLEGQYAVEFACQGAAAVGIEGREANLEKARFAQRALGLSELTFAHDDVRNLCPETYGTFDIVLCLGILYHLDAPDVFRFVENIGRVCGRFAVFDTFVSVAREERHLYRGKPYWGRPIHEHEAEASREARLARHWASLDNPRSLWLTRRSLLNLLAACGFTTVHECHVPAELKKPADRLTLVAFKGQRCELRSCPKVNELAAPDWPEPWQPRLSTDQDPRARLSKRMSHLVPSGVKRPLKRALRSVGVLGGSADPWAWDEPYRRRRASAKAAPPERPEPGRTKD